MYDVCIITTIHAEFDNRIYERQANALIDAGMRVCIVAPWNFARRSRSDFDFVQTKPAYSRGARVLHSYRTFLAALRVKARVYIFHDPDFLPFGWLLRRLIRKPVIYDCHENTPEDILYGKDWIPKLARRPLSFLVRTVEDAVVRRLGLVIAVVPHQFRRFRRLGADVQLVRNFSSFVVPEDFHPDRAVLYTGDLTCDYGVYNLVCIAREMKRRELDVPLRIVDRFYQDEKMRRHIHKIVEDENLNIEFLESVVAQEMPKILSKGCIGLSPISDSPNKQLAYPTKVFEYFMFGLAVVASDIAGTREILEHGRLGILVRPDDFVAWVDQIERLLNDKEYFEGYVRAGKNAIRETYNWGQEEKRLVSYVRSASRKEFG